MPEEGRTVKGVGMKIGFSNFLWKNLEGLFFIFTSMLIKVRYSCLNVNFYRQTQKV